MAASSIKLKIGTAPLAAQPRLEILHADAHVRAQTRFRDRTARAEVEQIFRA